MTFNKLAKMLEKQFGITSKPLNEFWEDEENHEGLWVTNNPDVQVGETGESLEAFNYDGWEMDPNEKIWEMGVCTKVHNFLSDHGMYAEPYDSGTWFIQEI